MNRFFTPPRARYVILPAIHLLLGGTVLALLGAQCIPDPEQPPPDNGEVDDAASVFRELDFSADEGTVHSTFDDRLRITQMTGPDGATDFIWSDDSCNVQVVQAPAPPISLETDFSEAGLMQAATEIAAEEPFDLSEYEDWLADRNVWLQLIGTGAVTLPAMTNQPAAAKPLLILQQKIHFDTSGDQVDALIDWYQVQISLLLLVDRPLRAYRNILSGNDDGSVEWLNEWTAVVRTIQRLERQRYAIYDARRQALAACRPCSPECIVSCSPTYGACYFGELCFDAETEYSCNGRGGIFLVDELCTEEGPWGSCCVPLGPNDPPTTNPCWETYARTCARWHGGFISGGSCGLYTCGEPVGACCTTIWETEDAPRDYVCNEMEWVDCTGASDSFSPWIACNDPDGVSCEGSMAPKYFP